MLAAAVLVPVDCGAVDFDIDGFVDARLVAPPAAQSWTNGGPGQTRFGGGGELARFGDAAAVGSVLLTPELLGVVDVQAHTTDQASIDLVEAYLRYRPVSTTPFRWSIKLGEFFPPLSLENDGVGWTSPWTLTPSAINSWIGEELRIIGSELHGEWRGETDRIEASAAVFGANDPAGAILAARGWSLSDVTYGIGGRLREPDSVAYAEGNDAPYRYDPFQQIGNRPGWYGDLTWRSAEFGRFSIMRYDNDANPASSVGDDESGEFYAWHTRFWSAGARDDFGNVAVIGQVMSGTTDILPAPNYDFATKFQAGYLLLGWKEGAWRPAVRFDVFATEQIPRSYPWDHSEHGNALTLALNWRPTGWCRVTAEILRVDRWRPELIADHLDAHTLSTQAQLGVRFLY
jgi:hypothetical protein